MVNINKRTLVSIEYKISLDEYFTDYLGKKDTVLKIIKCTPLNLIPYVKILVKGIDDTNLNIYLLELDWENYYLEVQARIEKLLNRTNYENINCNAVIDYFKWWMQDKKIIVEWN